MNENNLRKIRTILEQQRRLIKVRIDTGNDKYETSSPSNANWSDRAWGYQTRQHKNLFHAQDKKQLEKVEAALHRMDKGTFGVCPNCGETIHFERLKVMPTAILCIHCKMEQEKRS